MDLVRPDSGAISPELHEALLEFLLVRTANPHTRSVYARACGRLLRWSEREALSLTELRPMHLAIYVRDLSRALSAASVATHLSAIRRLYAWLIEKHLLLSNPAQSLRLPRVQASVGKTPVLDAARLHRYLDEMDLRDARERRDHALMSAMLYSFLRVGALLALRVDDVRLAAGELLVREKGGQQRMLPLHPELARRLDRYLQSVSFGAEPAHALFPAMRRGRSGRYGVRALSRSEAWTLVRKHLNLAGIAGSAGCHSFRATGITAFLESGGRIETAAYLAGHVSVRTTQLYDRRAQRYAGAELARMQFAREKGGPDFDA